MTPTPPSPTVDHYAHNVGTGKWTLLDVTVQAPPIGGAEEMETNEKGGKQSKLETRCDLLDGQAMFVLARVLKLGAEKYTPNNWRLIDEMSHVNHALEHLFRYLADQPSPGLLDEFALEPPEEDHLAHAFCRLMMAVAQREHKLNAGRNTDNS